MIFPMRCKVAKLINLAGELTPFTGDPEVGINTPKKTSQWLWHGIAKLAFRSMDDAEMAVNMFRAHRRGLPQDPSDDYLEEK